MAESAEAGLGLLTGAVPAVPDQAAGGAGSGAASGSGGQGGGADGAHQTAERVIRMWRRLGLSLATCAEQAVITPACGLAGASPAQARSALTRCHQAASMLPELIAETGGES